MKDILACALLMAAITVPAGLGAQPLPAENEWVVVIDAGHGGKDPGAVGSKAREKNINLAVALKTGKYIRDNMKDVKVIYTRDDDTYPGLAERAEVANRNKADLFISIHSNALTDKRLYGAETYVLGQTMDEANLQVAMKENSVITFEKDYETKYEGFDPNSVESYIIFSLMQNTYLKQSTEFATLIQDQFRERVGRKDRGVRQAGFVVLWRTTMPSVLVELGYITNPEEEKFLMSEQGQDYMASAIFRAFRDYKQTIDNRSGVKNGNGVVHAEASPPVTTDSAVAQGTEQPTGRTDSTHGSSGVPGQPSAVNSAVVTAQAEKTVVPPIAEKAAGPPAVDPGTGSVTDGTAKSMAATDEILFMVQVAAMPRNRELNQSILNGLEPLSKIEDGERIKYASGKFVLYDDALKHRRTLTGRFPDAFVIAVRNGKIMPLTEAIDTKKR
ncbi:MAG: N-acetylmuramoyl-L-alanine amidase [Bacteroidales bacterium]